MFFKRFEIKSQKSVVTMNVKLVATELPVKAIISTQNDSKGSSLFLKCRFFHCLILKTNFDPLISCRVEIIASVGNFDS